MANCILSNAAQEDLIRIHQFGMRQADKYFDLIAQQPFSFESADHIKVGYRRCVCGSDSIYYRVSTDIVEFMTIIGKQDLENIQ